MGKCRRGSRRCESLGRHPQHCTPPTPPCSRLEDSRKIKFHSNAVCVCCAMIQLHWTDGFVLLMRRHRAVCKLVIERSGNNKMPLYCFKVLNNGCLFPQIANISDRVHFFFLLSPSLIALVCSVVFSVELCSFCRSQCIHTLTSECVNRTFLRNFDPLPPIIHNNVF